MNDETRKARLEGVADEQAEAQDVLPATNSLRPGSDETPRLLSTSRSGTATRHQRLAFFSHQNKKDEQEEIAENIAIAQRQQERLEQQQGSGGSANVTRSVMMPSFLPTEDPNDIVDSAQPPQPQDVPPVQVRTSNVLPAPRQSWPGAFAITPTTIPPMRDPLEDNDEEGMNEANISNTQQQEFHESEPISQQQQQVQSVPELIEATLVTQQSDVEEGTVPQAEIVNISFWSKCTPQSRKGRWLCWVATLLVVTGIVAAIAVPIRSQGEGKTSPCDPNPCQNGGTCNIEDQENSTHSCECLDGYRGALCEDDLCGTNPCQNGGSCVRTADGFSCTCPLGYDGELCNNVLCSPNPCESGGTCSKEEDSYSIACFCEPGYSGERCETSLVSILFPQNGARVDMGMNGISLITGSRDDRDVLVAEIRVAGEAFDADNNKLATLDWVTRDDVYGKTIHNDVPAENMTFFKFYGTCDCLNRAWAILNPSGAQGFDEVQFYWDREDCEPSPQAAPGTQPRNCIPSYCPEGCGNHSNKVRRKLHRLSNLLP